MRAFDALNLLPPAEPPRPEGDAGTAQCRISELGAGEPPDVRPVPLCPEHRVGAVGGDVISQFEGYGDLKELDWDAYREKYGNIQRLDRILEAEDDDVNRYQASKQADALMLLYLMSSDELREILDRLGYRFTREQIPKTVDYYIARTSHGSTLSGVVHSWVLARGES